MISRRGSLQQAAHDLDALTFADREVRDQGGGLEGQAVLRRHPCDACAQGRGVECAGDGEGDVLHHRQRLEQREVLEDHADPEPPGGGRIRDRHRRAVPAKVPPRWG